jgi:hypothetical protein
MRWIVGSMVLGVVAVGLTGCIVVAPRPHPVVYEPHPVEVVPVAPGPEYIWVGGFYGPEGHWHHGYWRR